MAIGLPFMAITIWTNKSLTCFGSPQKNWRPKSTKNNKVCWEFDFLNIHYGFHHGRLWILSWWYEYPIMFEQMFRYQGFGVGFMPLLVHRCPIKVPRTSVAARLWTCTRPTSLTQGRGRHRGNPAASSRKRQTLCQSPAAFTGSAYRLS